MKSYALLGCFVVLTFVSVASKSADSGFHRFLNAVPEDVQTKCATEADLVADKAKILEDETSVDPHKLSCYTACVLKLSDTMKDGNILFDKMEKQMDMIFANDPDLEMRKSIVKDCTENMTGATDCEKIGSAIKCSAKKSAEKGI